MKTDVSKPMIVLVHGAFEDGSIWNEVVSLLWGDGFPVAVFANPLQGVTIDAAYLQSLMAGIETPLILVAHSYGGAVITQAGEDDKVRGLVYAASIIPAAGETASDLLSRYPGSSFLTSVREISYDLPGGPDGSYLLYQPDKFHSQVAADVPTSKAALMAATQRPMNVAALSEKLTRAAWTTKPSWQIRTLRDLAIPVAEQRYEAERAKSHVTEIDSSHAVTVSHPEVVADVIRQAAQSAVP